MEIAHVPDGLCDFCEEHSSLWKYHDGLGRCRLAPLALSCGACHQLWCLDCSTMNGLAVVSSTTVADLLAEGELDAWLNEVDITAPQSQVCKDLAMALVPAACGCVSPDGDASLIRLLEPSGYDRNVASDAPRTGADSSGGLATMDDNLTVNASSGINGDAALIRLLEPFGCDGNVALGAPSTGADSRCGFATMADTLTFNAPSTMNFSRKSDDEVSSSAHGAPPGPATMAENFACDCSSLMNFSLAPKVSCKPSSSADAFAGVAPSDYSYVSNPIGTLSSSDGNH